MSLVEKARQGRRAALLGRYRRGLANRPAYMHSILVF